MKWPYFILETQDGKVWLSKDDFENEESREIVFDIAFKLLDLAKIRIIQSQSTREKSP